MSSVDIQPLVSGARAVPDFATFLRIEMLLALRRRADIANPLLFFVSVLALLPLGLGPSPSCWRR